MIRSSKILILLLITLLFTACGSTAARYNNRGNSEFDQGNYQDALDNYRSAQNEDPDSAEPYYNSGNGLYRQGNFDSA